MAFASWLAATVPFPADHPSRINFAKGEARRIAANIAKLPELVRQEYPSGYCGDR